MVELSLSDIKVFILVGGLGTRLRSVVSDVPKPMAPIHGKPFLYYKMLQLKKRGIRNIVFCSGYLHQIIYDYFGDGSKFGINIEYSVENEPLGTAGAIKNAEPLINKPFVLMNGDTYLDLDFEWFISSYNKFNADYLMLLTTPHLIGQEGIVVVKEDNKIVKFLEKPPIEEINKLKTPYINAGVYLLNNSIVDLIPSHKKVSLEKEIFPKLVGDSPEKKFYGLPYNGYFLDIGVPENYKQFMEDVKKLKLID
ncbi:MAG: nucleotidyltransferase family protein [Promethearchaeota archaeon]